MREEESQINIFADKRFPFVDVALRKGYHFNDEELDSWQFLVQAKTELSDFYAKYNAELVYDPEGFIFLAAQDSHMRQSRLRPGEMIIGQVLALFASDPSILRNGGKIRTEDLLVRITHLVPAEQIPALFYAVRTKKIRTDVDAAKFRESAEKYLRSLASLGFLTLDREGLIRPHRSIFRFASLARVGADRDETLSQLEHGGYAARHSSIEIALGSNMGQTDEADDEDLDNTVDESLFSELKSASKNVLSPEGEA